MQLKLITALALLASMAAAATPAAAADWELIGVKEVADHTDHDTMMVEGHRAYAKIKVCVYRHPVHFYDLDIRFRNGGNQDVSIAARINAGKCTRVIDLNGGARDIERINFVYEETSFKHRTATVRVFGR